MGLSDFSNSSSFWTVRNSVPEQNAADNKTISVEILKIPEDLVDLTQSRKVEGEVVRLNDDGSVRIKTEQGDIDVRIRVPEQLQTGQKLEIEIPAGKTPHKTLIQLLSQNTIQRPPTASSTPQDIVELGSSEKMPLPNTTTAQQTQPLQTASKQHPSLIIAGQTIRMIPIPPAQLESLLQAGAEAFQTTISLPPEIKATLESLILNLPNIETETILQILSSTSSVMQALPQASGQTIVQTALPKASDNPLIFHLLNWQSNTASSSPLMKPMLTALTEPQAGISLKTPPLNPVLSAVSNAVIQPVTTAPTNTFSAIPQISQTLDIQILKIIPPSIKSLSQHQNSIPAPKAGLSQGSIIGTTTKGLPVLSFTPPTHDFAQNFILQRAATNLPIGTEIHFSSTPVSIPAEQQIAALPLTTPLPDIIWPPLNEIIETLLELGVMSHKQLAQILPSANHVRQMGAGLLFFLAAIRSGDITNFFSHEKINLLRQMGKTEALNRLSRDFGTLNRITGEPPASGQDWKTLPLPLFWEGQVEKIALHYKREDQGKENKNGEKEKLTRFIMELDLSRMGSVQIDALARTGKLDMIVRTQSALSQPMRQTMRKLYVEALEHSRITGELSFQHTPDQWVTINEIEQKIGLST